jgi:hypothetical protein
MPVGDIKLYQGLGLGLGLGLVLGLSLSLELSLSLSLGLVNQEKLLIVHKYLVFSVTN